MHEDSLSLALVDADGIAAAVVGLAIPGSEAINEVEPGLRAPIVVLDEAERCGFQG